MTQTPTGTPIRLRNRANRVLNTSSRDAPKSGSMIAFRMPV